MKKRGISAIVATVLIILITVAAITIIWAAIIPIISDQIDTETACLQAFQNLRLEVACKNATFITFPTQPDVIEIIFQIQRGPEDFEFEDLQFSFTNNVGERKSFLASDYGPQGLPADPSELPLPNGIRTYHMDFSGLPALWSDIVFNQEIGVAPVIRDGRKKYVCNDIITKSTDICNGADPILYTI